MPQITLKISSNIDIANISFRSLFSDIHETMALIPDLNIQSCQSGLIQEQFSYIGKNDAKKTKIFLEILWLENETRKILKPELAKNLLQVLDKYFEKNLKSQELIYAPRIRIANLGCIDQDYYIQV